MKKEKSIWLVTSEHLEKGLWFLEESDFTVGMNLVAAIAAGSPVILLAFVLMSNHVHFVIMGEKDEVEAFITEFKRRYSQYFQKKYGFCKLLKENDIDIRIIPFQDKACEKAIAYVHMNPVAANICSYPTQYPWGSGNVFFNSVKPKGVRVETLSIRMRLRTIRSKAKVPGHWLIGDDGFVLPCCYINRTFVETLFQTPRRMDYFLRNSSKAKMRLTAKDSDIPAFRDQLIVAGLADLCRSLFQKSSFEELSDAQKTETLRQARYRFSSNVHQLARVTGLTYEKTAKLLDEM